MGKGRTTPEDRRAIRIGAAIAVAITIGLIVLAIVLWHSPGGEIY